MIATGALNLRFPTGGCANGMRRNCSVLFAATRTPWNVAPLFRRTVTGASRKSTESAVKQDSQKNKVANATRKELMSSSSKGNGMKDRMGSHWHKRQAPEDRGVRTLTNDWVIYLRGAL